MDTTASSKATMELKSTESEAFCDLIIATQTQEEFQKLLEHAKFQVYAENQRVGLYLAREFIYQQQYQTARNYLQTVAPPTSVLDAYWYWNSCAILAGHFAEPFEHAFAKAREFCSGHELGVLWVNQGWAYHRMNNTQAALDCWKTAIEHIRFPSVAMALVDYNIGQLLLERLDPGAEFYFQQMQRITRYEVAAIQRPAAFLGLGDWHRLHGRFKQARIFYKRALKTAIGLGIVHSQIEAFAKLGFIGALEDQLIEAKQQIRRAIELIPEAGTYLWVYTVQAFYNLKANDFEAATRALSLAEGLSSVGFHRAQVLKAELERQLGNEKITLEILQTLDPQNIGARELVSQFPILFDLALQHGLRVEKILEHKRHFEVRALGRFSLFCDGRAIKLGKRCDEMLVYFLCWGARARDEVLESLYWEELKVKNPMTLKKARASFNKSLQRLRDALEWHEVVTLQNGNYVVNMEAAVWDLDWQKVSKKQRRTEFLISVERQWAKDIRELI